MSNNVKVDKFLEVLKYLEYCVSKSLDKRFELVSIEKGVLRSFNGIVYGEVVYGKDLDLNVAVNYNELIKLVKILSVVASSGLSMYVEGNELVLKNKRSEGRLVVYEKPEFNKFNDKILGRIEFDLTDLDLILDILTSVENVYSYYDSFWIVDNIGYATDGYRFLKRPVKMKGKELILVTADFYKIVNSFIDWVKNNKLVCDVTDKYVVLDTGCALYYIMNKIPDDIALKNSPAVVDKVFKKKLGDVLIHLQVDDELLTKLKLFNEQGLDGECKVMFLKDSMILKLEHDVLKFTTLFECKFKQYQALGFGVRLKHLIQALIHTGSENQVRILDIDDDNAVIESKKGETVFYVSLKKFKEGGKV